MVMSSFRESQVDFRVLLKLGCELNDKLDSSLQSDISVFPGQLITLTSPEPGSQVK